MKQTSVTTYLVVYAVLMVLLAVTVAVAYLDLGPLNLTITLLIAAAKAVLVGAYFMHLRSEIAMVRLAAAAGLLWLTIMIGLTMSDYVMRDHAPPPAGAAAHRSPP